MACRSYIRKFYTTIGCTDEVLVFDTIYSNVDKLSNELIMKMFGVQKFRMEKAPKQKGDIDCGLFAIAIATALAHFGLDGAMASTSFNQWHAESPTYVL